MSASVAPVRIERVRPHRPMRPRGHLAAPDAPLALAGATRDGIDVLDLVDTTATSSLVVRWHAMHERWDRAHELWRQMTFYLFDGDSWRR